MKIIHNYEFENLLGFCLFYLVILVLMQHRFLHMCSFIAYTMYLASTLFRPKKGETNFPSIAKLRIVVSGNIVTE